MSLLHPEMDNADREMTALGKTWINSQLGIVVTSCCSATVAVICYFVIFSKIVDFAEKEYAQAEHNYDHHKQFVWFYIVMCILTSLIPLGCVFLARTGVQSNNNGIATFMCVGEGVVSSCQALSSISTIFNVITILASSGLDVGDCTQNQGPLAQFSYSSLGDYGHTTQAPPPGAVSFATLPAAIGTLAPFSAQVPNLFTTTAAPFFGPRRLATQEDVVECQKFVDWMNDMVPTLKAFAVIYLILQCCSMFACVWGTMQSHKAKSALDRGLVFTPDVGRRMGKRGLKGNTRKSSPQPQATESPGAVSDYAPVSTEAQPLMQASPASSPPDTSFVAPSAQYANIASMPTYQPTPPSPPQQLYQSMPASNYAAALPTAAYTGQPAASMPTAAAMPGTYSQQPPVPTQYAQPAQPPVGSGYTAGFPAQTHAGNVGAYAAMPTHQGLY